MSKNTLSDLKKRRSIRIYKPEQIKDEELDAIPEAGTCSPTGMDSQWVVIVAVHNKTTISKIQKLSAEVLKDSARKPFYGTPTVVNVFVDKTKLTSIENVKMKVQINI
jgi:nitroreductase